VNLYDTLTYTLPTYSDPDGDTITLSLSNSMVPFVTISGKNSLIFAPNSCLKLGTFTFDLIMTDSKCLPVTTTISVTVTNTFPYYDVSPQNYIL